MKEYPIAGEIVSGLEVTDDIPNMGSIGASLYEYEILDDVREIPLEDLGITSLNQLFYAANDFESVRELAEEIKNNEWIDPLIVVIDNEGPYVLEGGHRLGALFLLKKKSFPALVVLDLEEIKNYCFCPVDDGTLYVETPDVDGLITLLLQQKFRNVAHFRTRHGYVPYIGGGIAFNAHAMYLKGVKPLWFLRPFGQYEIALDQLVNDGIFKNKREAERHYESQYIKECEWKGTRGLTFNLQDIDYIWIGPKKTKRKLADIKNQIHSIFPDLVISDEPPPRADNPCL